MQSMHHDMIHYITNNTPKSHFVLFYIWTSTNRNQTMCPFVSADWTTKGICLSLSTNNVGCAISQTWYNAQLEENTQHSKSFTLGDFYESDFWWPSKIIKSFCFCACSHFYLPSTLNACFVLLCLVVMEAEDQPPLCRSLNFYLVKSRGASSKTWPTLASIPLT